MKLVLLLLSCCIAATWQQQNQQYFSPFRVPAYRPPVPYYHQGPNYAAQQPYNPYYYYPSSFYQQPRKDVSLQNKALQDLLARLLLSQQLAAQNKQQDDSRVDYEQDDEDFHIGIGDMGEKDVVARAKTGFFRKKPAQVTQSDEEEADGRAFSIQNLIFKNQIYGTTTKYSIITSTLTTTTFISCLQSASFFGGSSAACRRKRDSALMADLLAQENPDGSLVKPTAVASIEPTLAVGPAEHQPSARSVDLDSSHSSDFPASRQFGHLDNFTGLYGKTVTSTLTSYSFISTLSKRTVSLGSSLSCLPAGYSVC